MPKPPRLEGGLIVRKGEAVPAVDAREPPPPSLSAPLNAERQALRQERSAASDTAPALPRGLAGTIAVTVRLDPVRYERMKVYGARRRRTNQELIVEALDAWMDRVGA